MRNDCSCVAFANCQQDFDERTSVRQSDVIKSENAICEDPRQGGKPEVPGPRNAGDNLICCHRDKVLKPGQPKGTRKCTDFARDGFICAKASECIDNLNKVDNTFSKSEYAASEGICEDHEDGSEKVCCLRVVSTAPGSSEAKCEENAGNFYLTKKK